ncbi:hypothetical protein VUR80DRAFT_2871 [Thermomyces stellatus]
MNGARVLESIPEVPTISVSAATEEPQADKLKSPPTSTRPSAGPQAKPAPPPTTTSTSSWWKRGLGMAFTGDSTQRDTRKGRMGSWWTGTDSTTSSSRSSRILTSAPSSRTPAAEVAAVKGIRKSLPVGNPEKNSALSSISSMISRFTTPQCIPAPDDELRTMDLEAALPTPSSPAPSPEDYHALHIQALTLLSRFQEAYKSQSAILLDLQAERDAERDEAAQVAARARHLRSQLDDVVARANEHEAAMAAALEELSAEKRARLEVEGKAPSSEGSVVTEDLAVEDDQRREGDETDEESIFSRSRSPPLPEGEPGASPPRPRIPPPRTGGPVRKAAPAPRLNAFQKIVRGIAGEDGDGRCSNCRGGDVGAAWDTVSLLRDENKGLKQRVGALEEAVQGALDAVNGVGL